MERIFIAGFILCASALLAFWLVTRPGSAEPDILAGLSADAVRGEAVFRAGGCAGCHAAKEAEGAERLKLGGGQRFASPFGAFVAPNISPDPEHGIGSWSSLDLVNAMHYGVSPTGQHYYPAFPYTSYARSSVQDVLDLSAYLATLPPVARTDESHEVGFPFNIRRLLGAWKRLYMHEDWIVPAEGLRPEALRGRYLVEGLAHCGACHTPRGAFGGPDLSAWLAGAPNPVGKGRIPNITPGKLTWSEAEIVEYLTSGFTPDYDTVGGEMAEVVENTSRLPRADREAIAAYLKAVPPVK